MRQQAAVPAAFHLPLALSLLLCCLPLAGAGLHLPLKTVSVLQDSSSPSPALRAPRGTTTRRPAHARGRDRSYISYVVELAVGSPPQHCSFIVDTGSAALAVTGPGCMDTESGRPCQEGLPTYQPGEPWLSGCERACVCAHACAWTFFCLCECARLLLCWRPFMAAHAFPLAIVIFPPIVFSAPPSGNTGRCTRVFPHAGMLMRVYLFPRHI